MDNSKLDLVFHSICGKRVVAGFDGGDLSSDAGLLLLSLAETRIGLLKSMSQGIVDPREQDQVDHHVIDMLQERVYAIASGY